MKGKPYALPALILILSLALSACGSAAVPTAPTSTVEPVMQESPTPTQVPITETPIPVDIREIVVLAPEQAMQFGGKPLLLAMEQGKDGYETAMLRYGDNSWDLGYCDWLCDSFVVNLTDGTSVAYLNLAYPNDWHSTIPVFLRDGIITVLDPIDGAIAKPEDITAPNRCLITSRVNALGTYGSLQAFTLTEDGLVPESTYVQILNEKLSEDGTFLDEVPEDSYTYLVFDAYGMRKLVSIRELTLCTDRGDVQLPEGTTVYPIGVDRTEGQFFVHCEDGMTGWLQISAGSKGWGFDVNGVDEQECFQMLPYAG